MANEVIPGQRYRFTARGKMKHGTEKDPKAIKRLKMKVQWALLDENGNEVHHFSKENCFIDKRGYPAIKKVTFDEKFVGQTLYMTPYTDEPDINVSSKVVVKQLFTHGTITVNCDGEIIKIVLDGYSNVFFDESGNRLEFNDEISLDQPVFKKEFNVGDKLFHFVSFYEIETVMAKAGAIKYQSDFNLIEKGKFYSKYAIASYYEYDFGHSYFKSKLNISSKDMSELYYGSGFVDNIPFVRFEQNNILHNIPDAGNFMWGHRAFLNELPKDVMLFAAAKNEGGADTDADTSAILNGYNYRSH